jgi:hypothetical protein
LKNNYAEGGGGNFLRNTGEFLPGDTLSEFSRELSLYKYGVIIVFIGLEFVSVCAMNGDVAFCINDGRFKYACAINFLFRATF